MEAILQFIGLVIYEAICAFLFGAFRQMTSSKKKRYLFFSLFPLAMMTMFHGSQIGNDTAAYIRLFKSMGNYSFSDLFANKRYEIGYLIYNYLLFQISDNPQILAIVTGAFVYFSYARWLKKWSKAPGLCICLFVEMLFFDSWISMVRQAIVIALLFFAYDFLVKRKVIPFTIIVLFATFFHNAAYIFLLAYPIVNIWQIKTDKKSATRRLKNEVIALMLGIVFSFGFNKLFTIIVSFFPQYSYYLNGIYVNGEPRVAVILKIIIYAVMIIIPSIIRDNLGTQDQFDLLSEQSLYKLSIINITLTIMANQATIIMRLADLFSTFAIISYCNNIAAIRYAKNREIMTIVSIVLFAIYGIVITVCRTPEWQTTYPFMWCWQ